MSIAENPFTPSFGEMPAHLAGRKDIINSVQTAFSSSSRSPELTCMFSGARGTGKTTLMSFLISKAEAQGWISANTTAMPGMLEDLEISIIDKASDLVDVSSATKKTRVSGVSVSHIGSVTFDSTDNTKSNWRSRVAKILDLLAEQSTGLLITVDEIDPSLSELVELVAVYQHFVRERRRVSLLMAGLPSATSALMTNKTVSFIRRASLFDLRQIDDFYIEEALRKTIRENGRSADDAGIEAAVSAIAGFPFLLQLVGYRAWNVNPATEKISCNDFEEGIHIAQREMKARILDATYLELSDSDKLFLSAMLQDEKDSKTADLVKRLQWSDSQVAQYRRRLITAGIIGSRGRGAVGFDMPFFREFLEDS